MAFELALGATLGKLKAERIVSCCTAYRSLKRAGSLKYGQARLDGSDRLDLEADRAEYEADRARVLYLNGEHGIDEVMNALEKGEARFIGEIRLRACERYGRGASYRFT